MNTNKTISNSISQKAEQKQSKLRQQNSLQLNSTPNPPTVLPRSDSSASVNTGK